MENNKFDKKSYKCAIISCKFFIKITNYPLPSTFPKIIEGYLLEVANKPNHEPLKRPKNNLREEF